MSLQLFLAAMRARLRVFALLLAATVLGAAVASVVLPKTYTATVSLLVDAKEEQSLSNVLRPLIAPQEKISYLETQADIITSRKVARKVVDGLALSRDPKLQAKFQDERPGAGTIEDWLVERLLKELKVKTSQSSVVLVSFSSHDAEQSAAVANAFANAYIDTMLELRVDPTREAAAWFDEQLKSLRANLQEAQAALTEYYRRRGIVSADERYDVENTQLERLSEQMSRAREQSSVLQSREEQIREFLAQGGSADRLPDVLDNAFIQKLKADLVGGEAKLQELLTQYGENHPRYQRQLSENQILRQQLDAEVNKVVAAIEHSARQSRLREVEARRAMAAQRARILDLKDGRNELTVLRRNVESAEKAYDTAMQRYVVSRVDSRANQTNVTVLNPAVAPLKPARPNLALNIALSVVVGTMLGIGMVMLLEIFDRRVRLRADLRLDDVPLLAVVNRWQPADQRRLGRPAAAGPALPNAY